MPIKVYELAKEFGVKNTEMVKTLTQMGMERLSPSSDLNEADEAKARAAFDGRTPAANGDGASVATATVPSANGAASSGANGNGSSGTGRNGATAAPNPRTATPAPAAARPSAPAASSGAPAPAGGSGEPIEIPSNISIKELAEKLAVGAGEIQKILVGYGILAGLNQRLAPDAVQRIAQKLNKNVRFPSAPATAVPATAAPQATPSAPANGASAPVATRPTGMMSAKPGVPSANRVRTAQARTAGGAGGSGQGMVVRPPVVTIMGHVDHGKTTLLDTIRKASVASGEAGGITQHIGAYQVEANGQRITFLDTPGHAAFGAMRARGASITDIVVIVVAADDSVMPQTEEAIKLAKEAGVPIIVAVNKVDLPDADPDRVLTDLTRYDIVPEAFGGDVQTVNISAKKNEGISELLDTILLVSEAVVEPKADPHGKAQGTVIEAKQEKGRGPVVSVLVQQGTLKVGDVLVAGTHFGKIKGMTDERGTKLTKAGPSSPVEIVGLGSVPDAGDRVEVARDEKDARAIVARRDTRDREERLGQRNMVTLEALYKQLRSGPVKELNIVIKGDVQGSVQAVRDSLVDLGNDEVKTRILLAGVGAVSENDLLIASSDKDAEAKNSLVVGFNVGLANGVEKKAETEHVTVKTFSIIYELIDAVKAQMVSLLDPIYEEAILGKSEVRQLFRLPGARSIAGCYVTDGLMRRNTKARLFRNGELMTTADIDTLKRFKDDAREVQTGYECGITLRDYNALAVGDVIECFEMRAIPREL